MPDNVQVYDQHAYVGLYPTLYSQTVWRKDFDPANPKKNELLRRLLKEPFLPYDQFVKAAPLVREFWQPVCWLYHNLDMPRFDQWILAEYKRDGAKLKAKAVKISRATPRRRRGGRFPRFVMKGVISARRSDRSSS